MPGRVLVIDDEPDILKEITFILRRKGFEVVTAADGQQALRRVHESRPDLILLDLRLPVIDGFEVSRQLKSQEAFSTIPIILLTASTDYIEKKKNECMAQDYILKPFDYQELLKKVESFLPE